MTTSSPAVVTCPTCKKPVNWIQEQIYRPFCSQRCRLIDLGDWATEAHKIPGDPLSFETGDDLEDDL